MARVGEYVAIDLDENNRLRAAWAKSHPGQTPRPFGWGVCRHGYGFQGHRGVLTEAQARAWAARLNGAWYPANHGTGKRIWFLYREHPEVHERYQWSKNGRLIRYASMATAQRAADRLNAESAS